MKFNRTTVLHKLNWPPFNFEWPPHKYPWSDRDEKRVLLWLSTLYETAEEMINDLKEHELHEHLKLITWLLPNTEVIKPWEEEVESISSSTLLNFSCNCLEKALLWHNPDYHWQSGLTTAVDLSRNHLNGNLKKETLNKEIDSSSFLGSDGWGDLGWIKHEGLYGDFIHTFYDGTKN